MDKQRLKKVRVENLEPNTRLTDDILSAKQTVLLRSGTILKHDFVTKLSSWGIGHVYTHSEQFTAEKEMDEAAEAVLDFFAANKEMFVQRAELKVILADKELEALVSTTEGLYENILAEGETSIQPAMEIVQNMLRELPPLRERLFQITAVIPEAKYIMQHAVTSTVLFSLVLRADGYDQARIVKLAVGALFRDLGMAMLPASILTKRGALSEKEFAEVKKHPGTSATLLKKANAVENETIMLVLQHHERWDGRGYPNGFQADEIVPEAQVLSICDAFDAMASDRSYRRALSPYEAVTKIISLSGKQFSQLAANRFINRFGLYPVGTFVKLSDNTYAIVTRINEGRPTHPVVKVILNDKLEEFDDGAEHDLAKIQDLFIVKVYKA
jgi:HD-GYP domain-containing protein (c-di-GMP phosphodiesterase class II)